MSSNKAETSPSLPILDPGKDGLAIEEREMLADQFSDIRSKLAFMIQGGSQNRYVLVDCLHDARVAVRAISLAQPASSVHVEANASVHEQLANANKADQQEPRIQRYRLTQEINQLLDSPNETPEQVEISARALIRLTKSAEERILPSHIGEGGAFREFAIESLPSGKVLGLMERYQSLGTPPPSLSGSGVYPRTSEGGTGHTFAPGLSIAYEAQAFPGRRDSEQPDSVKEALSSLAKGDTRTALVMNADTPNGAPVLVVPAMAGGKVISGHVVMVGEQSAPLIVDLFRRNIASSPAAIHDRLADNLKHLVPKGNGLEVMDEIEHLKRCVRELPTDGDEDAEITLRYAVPAFQERLRQLAKKVSTPTADAGRGEKQAQIALMDLAHTLGIEREPLTTRLPQTRGTFSPDSSPAAYLGVKKDGDTGEYRYALINRVGDKLSAGGGYPTHKAALQSGLRSAREINATGGQIPTLAIRQPEYDTKCSGYQVIGLTERNGEPGAAQKLGHWMTNRSRAALTGSLTPEQMTDTTHWKTTIEKYLGAGRTDAETDALRMFISSSINPDSADINNHATRLSGEGLTISGTDTQIRLSDYLLKYGTDDDIRLAAQLQVGTSALPASEKSALMRHFAQAGSMNEWIAIGQQAQEQGVEAQAFR